MRKFKIYGSFFLFLLTVSFAQAQNGKIRLLVRSDDMASSHAANVSCIKAAKGISRSVEVMVPCPWFNEAAKMLNENPGIDVGVHLTLTSEWEGIKWGPITPSPSLADSDGEFLSDTGDWYKKNYKMAEVEAELRKQIELAIREIPKVTHLSSHMGAPDCKPELKKLVQKLAKEYKLIYETPGMANTPDFGWNKALTFKEKEAAFVTMLKSLKPGKAYLFVEHPGNESEEMLAIGNKGMKTVAHDRNLVTEVFTSDLILKVIRERGIELINYTAVGERGN
ncbi:MAG: ChbG/HpnK family deacetylase [Mariniphaga sp.]|nr:ChbG/HpnK family deacetylase [Mariniphaga sp.]